MLNVWIGNLGKYNEGELKGGWLELPKSKDEINEFLQNVVGLNKEYEEYMINDYETDLPYKVGEYENLDSLNLLAKVSEKIEDMDVILGYQESEGDLDIVELMNLIMQEEDISFYNYTEDSITLSNERKYGYTVAESMGLLDTLQENNIEMYFDFEEFGKDCAMNDYVELLEKGYIDKNDSNIRLNLYSEEEIRNMIEESNDMKKEDKLKIIYKEVGKDPVEMEIENTLEAKQKLVNGLIEVVPYKDDLLLICNEEGKIENLKPNLKFDYDYIAGNCFVVGDDYENGDFKSINSNQVEEIKNDLKDKAIVEEINEEEDMEF